MVQQYLKVVLVQNLVLILHLVHQLQQKVVVLVDTDILLMNLVLTHYFLD